MKNEKPLVNKEEALQLLKQEDSLVRTLINCSTMILGGSCLFFILTFYTINLSSLIIKIILFTGSLIINIYYTIKYRQRIKNIFSIASVINPQNAKKKIPIGAFLYTSLIGYFANIAFLAHTLIKLKNI